MATFDFQTVLVWTTNPGGVVRLLRNGAVTVYNAATDAALFNLTSDSQGLVSFTTTDVPTVYLRTTGWTSEHITAASAIEAAAAFSTSEDAAVATLVNDTGSATRAGLNSTFATGGQVRSKVKTDGTDQAATLNAELQDLYAAGGGTLVLPAGSVTLAGQVVFPNDGGGIFVTDAQLQRTITLQGQGGFHSGQVQTSADTGGTRLVCTYTNATYNNAKFVTRGLGKVALRDIVFVSPTANDSTPFVFTTNTTLHVQGCAFLGATSGTSSALDCLVLGGTKKHPNGTDINYDDPDSAFQGYGTMITGNYFDRVRRVVYGRSYCNHTVTAFNFVDKGCGSNLAGGACIEFNGNLDVANGSVQPGDYCTGNQVYGNYLNGLGYYYQVKLTQALRCVVFGNGSPDPQVNLVALVGCFAGTEASTVYPATQNQVYGNHVQAVPNNLFEDAASTGLNTVIGGGVAEGTKLRGNVAIEPGAQNPAQIGKVNFTGTIASSGTSTHYWTIPDPLTFGAIPWKLTAKDTNQTWLALQPSASPMWSIYGQARIEGTTGVAGSTALTIGNNSTVSDAVLTFNAPTGKQNQVQFKRAGTNSWLVYDANTTSLFVRDSVSAVMALELKPGATNTGRALFAGSVESGRWVKTQAVATGSRPSASTAGVGAMMFDSDLGKPIWSNGTAWVDATGATV